MTKGILSLLLDKLARVYVLGKSYVVMYSMSLILHILWKESLLNKYDTNSVEMFSCITFCAFDSFNRTDLFWRKQSYSNSTFELNNIFDVSMAAHLSKVDEFYMVESQTLLVLGHFTVCHQSSVWWNVLITFLSNKSTATTFN